MINELIRACDTDLAAEPAPAEAVLAGERRALARAITCLQAGWPQPHRQALAEAARARRVPVLGHHRDRRVREVVADRRTGPPVPHRPAGQAADRGARGGPDPAARRRRLLGDRIRMNALDGDHVFFRSLATRGGRELPEGIERRHHGVQGRRLRPGHPGNAGDRAGRRGGDGARGRVAVRDDAGVRRRVAAGEDRHARLRRRGRGQQVRAARRRGRAPGRVAGR